MDIKYLKNSEINFIRWDNCINNSINGNIFVYSWYLNIIGENWDALISGDYDYVMPLVHTRKFNHDILFSSKIGSQYGIFSNKLLSDDIVQTFLKYIPKKFSYVNILLNKYNKLTIINSLSFKSHEIDLIQTYANISKNYSNHFQKNIHIAISNHYKIVKGMMPNDLILLAKSKKHIAFPALATSELQELRRIIAHGLRYGLVDIQGVYNIKNTLCAAILFLKSKYKIYVLYSAVLKREQNTYPLHYLIDKFIESHAEKNLTLNLDNIVLNNDIDFYSGIGAQECILKRYVKNKLAWYHKLLIKTN